MGVGTLGTAGLWRRRYGVGAARARLAAAFATSGGVLLLVIPEDSVAEFVVVLGASLSHIGLMLSAAYQVDRSGVNDWYIIFDADDVWPLHTLHLGQQEALQLRDLRLQPGLRRRLDGWASVPPCLRDGTWISRGETLAEQLQFEVGSQWQVDSERLRGL